MNSDNHIEYNREEYVNLITNLSNVSSESFSDVHEKCNMINSIIDGMHPEKCNCDVSSLESTIKLQTAEIECLVGNILLSLKAYDNCDSELKELVDKYIVDALFGEEIDGVYANKYDGILRAMVGYGLPFTQLDAKDYERMGFTEEQVNKYLDKFDFYEKIARVNALKNNCPDNYADFNFNPGPLLHDYTYYGISEKALDKYDLQSEVINVNGFQVEIVQMIPKNCSDIELLLYNYAKANTINTLSTLPADFLGCVEEFNNAIVLACDIDDYMNKDMGYTLGLTFNTGLKNAEGVIVLDAHGSFYNSDIWITESLIHEMGHKFDNAYNDDDYGYSTGQGYDEWNGYRKKYARTVAGIIPGGYSSESLDEDHVHEFYAECIQAYFLAPDELKVLCPNVYDAITIQLANSPYGKNN